MTANSRRERASLRWLVRLVHRGSCGRSPMVPLLFGNSTSVQSLREVNPTAMHPGRGDCYLFMRRVSPHTCARIPAARHNLPLAPAWHGPEEPSGLGTWATATRSLQSRWRGTRQAPFPPRSCLGVGTRGGHAPGRPRPWPRLSD